MKKSFPFLLLLLFLLNSCNEKTEKSQNTEAFPQKQAVKTEIIDLSHSYSDETVYWVTAKEFNLDTVFKGKTDKGFFYAANNFSTAEHGGTHIDAPIHFAEKGQSVDEIPLEKLIGAAIKIDVSKNALPNPDYLITIDDLKAWEQKENTKIPNGSIVLLQTGFAKYYPNKVKYMGTDERGEMAVEKLHFPGLSAEAAEWLVQQRNINAIGIDTPSIDYGQSTYFKSHVILLQQNIPAFENLTNLDKLPSSGFEIIALPMKIKGGSGAPLRIVAIVKK
ncbi:kynurenine formamidase [Kordia sp. SMS9]|uniref:cyclase family protein n=1 Tax=Kordia sp. SMS9 TaxID=2282170 RepID=UPI000E0D8F97|nr:cyclase family protein [Kordia sp. SMS9]AXG69101.1 kynurenine formamidase [Kordia sp. SMS9]